MRKVFGLFALLIAFNLGPVSARPQNGYDLFQKALIKERAEGQLDEAVRMYQQIIKEFAGNRALVAKALVQMGNCYEKLKHPDARKTYERVIREFSDQMEAVLEARSRLSGLAEQRPLSSSMAVRQVWSGPGVDLNGSIAPDGKYLSFVDWSNLGLAVRDLATGTNRRLDSANDGQLALNSAISSDGKQVAYASASLPSIFIPAQQNGSS